MSKSFVKKDDNKKDKLINGLIIGVIVVIVGALAIMVSNNKTLENNSRIKEVSYSEYKEKIQNDGYTIVLLASPSCSHCRSYKPFVNNLAEEYNFDVYYVNVNSSDLKEEEYDELHDSIMATKEQFGSNGSKVIPTPTTVIFKNGVEVASKLGDIGYDGLKSLLEEHGVI